MVVDDIDRADDSIWPVPRAVYIHVPFCRHRCGYCNFSVVAGRDELIDAFVDAIESELSRLDRPEVDSVFIGGGTPTHLPPHQLNRLLETVSSRFQLAADCEWSVEANPEDIDQEKLQLLAGHGVNRISLGVQSFDSRKLAQLERGHSGAHAATAIEMAAETLPVVSLDLIFAAPGESVDDWRRDLQTAIDLPVKHLSTYALTFEKGTSFWSRRRRGQLCAVEEETEVDMYQLARSMTEAAGIEQYEVSNFARLGFRCRHNQAYWRGLGWFAAGPGAARFVDGRRETNHRSPTTYLKRIQSGDLPVAEVESLDPVGYARELAAFGVRMMEGVDLSEIADRTGVDVNTLLADSIDEVCRLGNATFEAGRLRLTHQGVLFADAVAAEMLSP